MKKGKSTQAIHGRIDAEYRSSTYPIYQTTTFAVENSDEYYRYIRGDEEFYIYTRSHNPTVRNVEEKLAKLENAEEAVLFASGMAAITSSMLAFVQAGDTIVSSRRLYGTTFRFLVHVASGFGIKTVFLDDDRLYELDRHVPEAKLVYFESPINPTSRVLSMARVVEAAKKVNAVTMIDSTFGSPVNQNPIDFGVDVVVHSATKYIGGHSDVMGGVAVGAKSHIDPIRGNMKTFGGCTNPQDAFLLDRSLKTLKLRVEGHNVNAMALAQFFADDNRVQRVYYPGLADSPDHEIARAQMRGFGGMMCIELADLDAAKRLCDSLQIALNATSLGGAETLVSIPVLTSHIKMSDDELAAAGVAPGMVRISVGLEDIDDLIADFQQALASI